MSVGNNQVFPHFCSTHEHLLQLDTELMLDACVLMNKRKTLTAFPKVLLPYSSLLPITLLGFGGLLLTPLGLRFHPGTQIK